MIKKAIISILLFFYKKIYRLKLFFRKRKVLTEEDVKLIRFMKEVWNVDVIFDKKGYYTFDFKEYNKSKEKKY